MIYVYVFGRTTGDAQTDLKPRYGAGEDSFTTTTSHEMIDHLAKIYLDPFKTQNARQDYRRLNMKSTQPFTKFYIYEVPPPSRRGEDSPRRLATRPVR